MLSKTAESLLSAAITADGCPAWWLISAVNLAETDPQDELQHLVDRGLLRLVLCPQDSVRVCGNKNLRNLTEHPNLGPLVLAWQELHGHRTRKERSEPTIKRLPQSGGWAVIPAKLGDTVLVRRLMTQQPTTTVSGLCISREGTPKRHSHLAQARWVPFTTPLVLAWPNNRAIYRPCGAQKTQATRDEKLAEGLLVFAKTLYRLAAEPQDAIIACIIQELNSGHSDRQAAKRLGMSERQFRRYVATIMHKTSASSRWQAATRIESGRWPMH